MLQTFTLDVAREAVEAAGLFSSTCTIQNPPATVDAQGNQDLNPLNYTNATGLVAIKCMAAPLVIERPDAQDENAMAVYTKMRDQRRVLLNGHYPQITQKQQALIDGLYYDILAVESDSQGITTRLAVQVKQL